VLTLHEEKVGCIAQRQLVVVEVEIEIEIDEILSRISPR
jgi:hypothetical protein